MITIRKSHDRGHADHGWLNSQHTFSFADYYDQRHMGFRALRVINEDRVQPGKGFPTHPHRDMEIISYVLEGALEHRDSMGNGSVIRPGDVQRMSAGTGITHSEYNHSPTEQVHFLQIWILPSREGVAPGYEQKTFPEREERGVLRLVASPDGRAGSVMIHQDVNLYATALVPGEELVHPIPAGRHAWLQVARGPVLVNGLALEQGDGAAVSGEEQVLITGREKAELLLFDLA
ncbi:pirin family protein [Geobacter sp. FeAm09]|uniref:pirin family protein n=1 Tax=Geobacter sp. FeAm09 TaxID=2597769 RepID=UPI0011EEE3EA|nr:pirin family protein [Geobacter sp. FeAm09]QEM69953.1 pirin family protein [Geobacter sp. FeAm09]